MRCWKLDIDRVGLLQNKNTTDNAPESPTTARPFDLDDDDVQDNNMVGDEANAATTPVTTQPASDVAEAAPPKPPRPSSVAQQNIVILKEAFPSVDEAVIKAVLSASGGRVEPAFNALLGTSLSGLIYDGGLNRHAE
jgi:hypothetical protein